MTHTTPKTRAYYNENNKHAAAWLRELIKRNLIAPGDVDERSIKDVQAADVSRYTQAHFFAGIGGWSYALRLAGWSDARSIWTGSCPCQPFSAAGKRKGATDDRHLWPDFHRIIASGNPAIVIGEQVASADGRVWLAGVRTDLEALGYEVGAADLCAAGVSAPHIRQRLWWVADAKREQSYGGGNPRRWGGEFTNGRTVGGLADPHDNGRRAGAGHANGMEASKRSEPRNYIEPDGRLGNPLLTGLEGHARNGDGRGESKRIAADQAGSTSETSGLGGWSAFDLIPCQDGKARRIEPGTFPLAHGVPGRVGLLRGYGNAIVPQVAAEFIAAYMECVE